MSTSFFSKVKKATPKPSIKLIESPMWENYRKFDDMFAQCAYQRIEVAKACLRAYQNNKRNVCYTIEELEHLISDARDLGITTDEYFDRLLIDAMEDKKIAILLSMTFLYLRNELKNPDKSHA